MFDVTKEFIAALKAADRAASVYIKQADTGDDDPRHRVKIKFTARIQAKAPKGFEIENSGLYAEADSIFEYRSRGPIPDEYKAAAFCSLHPQQRGGWAALALILRPGDMLTLIGLDNRSGNLKERDLHADTLFATVTRRGKLVIDALALEYSGGCPDNSARSLKR